jgi:hypothetical protein
MNRVLVFFVSAGSVLHPLYTATVTLRATTEKRTQGHGRTFE